MTTPNNLTFSPNFHSTFIQELFSFRLIVLGIGKMALIFSTGGQEKKRHGFLPAAFSSCRGGRDIVHVSLCSLHFHSGKCHLFLFLHFEILFVLWSQEPEFWAHYHNKGRPSIISSHSEKQLFPKEGASPVIRHQTINQDFSSD